MKSPKNLKSLAKPIVKAPKTNHSKPKSLSQVISKETPSMKKIASKAKPTKKDGGAKTLPVGVTAPAKMSKGMKKTKPFRSPFNQ